MDRKKEMKENINNRLDVAIFIVMCLLALSSCISEAMARNFTRVVLILAVVRCILQPRLFYRLRHIKSLLIVMLLFFGVMVLSAIYGGNFWSVVQENLFWFQYSAVLLPVCLLILNSKKQVKTILYCMFFSMAVSDVYIFYQTIQGVFRPSALLMDGVMTGTVLVMCIVPAMVAMLFEAELAYKERIFVGICTLMSMAGIICLNTRGGWLAVFPVLACILLYCIKGIRKKIAVLLLCCLAGGTVMMMFPGVQKRASEIVYSSSQQSATERMLMWQSAYQMGMDNPVLGVGKGNYTDLYQHKYISPIAKEPTQGHAHSNYFQMFAENGFLGLFTYCGMIGMFLCWGWSHRKNIYGVVLCGATAAFSLYGVTDYTLAAYGGMRVYWLLMGLCVAALWMDKDIK